VSGNVGGTSAASFEFDSAGFGLGTGRAATAGTDGAVTAMRERLLMSASSREPKRLYNVCMRIPVPDPIRRIADGEDRKLAWYFFVCFSRMEYALKRSARYLKEGTPDAQPDWDRFASDYSPTFSPDASTELHGAVDYLLKNPPRKQLRLNGKMAWSKPQAHDGKEPLLVWLLRMLRCVRNNFFHGGKFPLIPISDPSRDRELLVNSIIVLTAALSLDPDVKMLFLEDIEA